MQSLFVSCYFAVLVNGRALTIHDTNYRYTVKHVMFFFCSFKRQWELWQYIWYWLAEDNSQNVFFAVFCCIVNSVNWDHNSWDWLKSTLTMHVYQSVCWYLQWSKIPAVSSSVTHCHSWYTTRPWTYFPLERSSRRSGKVLVWDDGLPRQNFCRLHLVPAAVSSCH